MKKAIIKIWELGHCFFSKFTTACKKSVHSIYSFLWYSQLLTPVTRLATHTQPCLSKYVNFYTMEKIRLFLGFVLEIWLIKNSSNLIGWEHFGPYRKIKNSPKYGICAGIKQINCHYRGNLVKQTLLYGTLQATTSVEEITVEKVKKLQLN